MRTGTAGAAVGRRPAAQRIPLPSTWARKAGSRAGLVGVAHRRVPGAAAVVVRAHHAIGWSAPIAPRRCRSSRRSWRARGRAARVGAEVVPLVGSRPAAPAGRRSTGRAVVDVDACLLDRRVIVKYAPTSRRTTASRTRCRLPSGRRRSRRRRGCSARRPPAGGVEHVAGREQEHHGPVAARGSARERAGVLGGVDGEAVRRAELLTAGSRPGSTRAGSRPSS